MAYYLKFPADTGTPESNNKLVQLSGIATTGNVNIALKFAENVVDPVTTLAKGAYLYDGRRTLNSTAGGSGGYLLEYNNVVEQSNTSNWKLNGIATDHRSWRSALADDVYSFDSGSQVDGVISIGARFNQTENMPLLALKSITITDSNGTHIIDMSASNGTANTFTSTDGVVTLTLFGFTGTSHWVFYSSGGTYTLSADGATFSYSGAAASTLFNRQLPSDGATYSYSGGAASTLYNRRLSADGAVYAYSGGAAVTLYNRKLSADGGTYSYSGAAATLTYTAAGVVYTLNADGAVFGYTGSAASLLANRALTADGGSFTYSGGNSEFDFNGYPQADAGAFVVSYRIAGDTVLTASISESTRFSAIISQSTTVRYMVN